MTPSERLRRRESTRHRGDLLLKEPRQISAEARRRAGCDSAGRPGGRGSGGPSSARQRMSRDTRGAGGRGEGQTPSTAIPRETSERPRRRGTRPAESRRLKRSRRTEREHAPRRQTPEPPKRSNVLKATLERQLPGGRPARPARTPPRATPARGPCGRSGTPDSPTPRRPALFLSGIWRLRGRTRLSHHGHSSNDRKGRAAKPMRRKDREAWRDPASPSHRRPDLGPGARLLPHSSGRPAAHRGATAHPRLQRNCRASAQLETFSHVCVRVCTCA